MSKRKTPPSKRVRQRDDRPNRHIREAGRPSGRGRDKQGKKGEISGSEPFWLYGVHAVLAALGNPARQCRRLLVSGELARKLADQLRPLLKERQDITNFEPVSRQDIATVLPKDAVHQGIALLVSPLPQPALESLMGELLTGESLASVESAENSLSSSQLRSSGRRRVIVVLDQASDPHNIGAVLRSAAAFGAAAVITTKHNAPPETGVLAKAASGALEQVPYIRVANLARTLESLKKSGFWCLGLAGEGKQTLAEADPGGPLVLIAGAEGSGLRHLTREHCDFLARIPTQPPIEALNLSNAAAVALYELLGRTKVGSKGPK